MTTPHPPTGDEALPRIGPSTPLHRLRCALQYAQPSDPSVMIPQGDARVLLKLVSVTEDLNNASGDSVDYWLEELAKVMDALTTDTTKEPK